MTTDFAGRLAGAPRVRRADSLRLVLGDQLDREAVDRGQGESGAREVVLMIEAAREATHVPSHRQRTTLFLSAMRHFALDLLAGDVPLRYVRLDDPRNEQSLGAELVRAIEILGPARVVVVQPGEHRVETELREACAAAGVPLDVEADRRFSCTLEAFEAWAAGRRSLVMEYFYRERRRALGVLTEKGQPAGGAWNFDKENRRAFSSPPSIPVDYRARPDAITGEVMALVTRAFPDAYGRLDHFRWPVVPEEARRLLASFVEKRLPHFGTYQDAMWTGEPVLYHSKVASSLNLGLLSPHACVDAAVEAYESGHAPINAVEGFVRQIIGWREFIRGVYFHEGPGYSARNELGHEGALPDFYWTGETEMACLHHTIGEVVELGWGHHIARLMVIGNFALIAGVRAGAVNDWFLAMYVDAVDWVTAPNVVGMSQHADGGVVGTKPYAGSGKYIDRMSNYCASCPFDPRKRTGEDACPFNVFYWDFLQRHRERFRDNRRMGMMLRNVERMDAGEAQEIRRLAEGLRKRFGIS